MAEYKKLYGFQLVPERDMTLADQFYGILKEEILKGRWKIGERLPSFSDLSQMTGLSAVPIRQAMENLEKEGYIAKKERKGIFLKSVLPQDGSTLGNIGIVIEEISDTSLPGITTRTLAFGAWNLNIILNVAIQRHFRPEVVSLKKDADWETVDRVGAAFSNRVKGIICLHPYPRQVEPELTPDRIPLVFLGVHDDRAVPCVTGDPREAMYLLTRRLMSEGHREIVVCCEPQWDGDFTGHVMEGHSRAMKEEGLDINRKAVEQSMGYRSLDVTSLVDFLHTCNRATAVISTSPDIARKIVEVADAMGILIPGDLSIACLGNTPMRQHDQKRFLGIRYDWEGISSMCFDILSEQMRTRRCSIGHIVFRPFYDGNVGSLAPPREEPVLQCNLRMPVMSQEATTESVSL